MSVPTMFDSDQVQYTTYFDGGYSTSSENALARSRENIQAEK
jgi:hypothetical protein